MCENDCISSIYNIVGMGVVSVPTYLRNDIIRANLLCSKVPVRIFFLINIII